MSLNRCIGRQDSARAIRFVAVDDAKRSARRRIVSCRRAEAGHGAEMIARFGVALAAIGDVEFVGSLIDAISAGRDFLGAVDAIVGPKVIGRLCADDDGRMVGVRADAGGAKVFVGTDRSVAAVSPDAQRRGLAADLDQGPTVAILVLVLLRVLPEDRIADAVRDQAASDRCPRYGRTGATRKPPSAAPAQRRQGMPSPTSPLVARDALDPPRSWAPAPTGRRTESCDRPPWESRTGCRRGW